MKTYDVKIRIIIEHSAKIEADSEEEAIETAKSEARIYGDLVDENVAIKSEA